MFNLVQVYFLSFPSSFQIFGTIFSSSEEKAIVSRTGEPWYIFAWYIDQALSISGKGLVFSEGTKCQKIEIEKGADLCLTHTTCAESSIRSRQLVQYDISMNKKGLISRLL